MNDIFKVLDPEAAYTLPPPRQEFQLPEVLRRAALCVVLASLMFGVLAFGAVTPLGNLGLQLGAILAGLCWAGAEFANGQVRLRGGATWIPVGGFALVVLFQLVFHRSIYSHDTISAALGASTCVLLFFVTVHVVLKVEHWKMFLVGLVIFGAALSFFALVQHFSSNGKIYWVVAPRWGGGSIFGPYVNHNHYAGAMEMLAACGLVTALKRGISIEWRLLAALAAVLMTASIFVSGSRGGMIAVAAEILLFMVLLLRRWDYRTGVALGVLCIAVLGMLFWIGNSALGERIATIPQPSADPSARVRYLVFRDSLYMIRDAPLLGTGLGTFGVAYPRYRTFYSDNLYDHAHNDFIELTVETGFLGLVNWAWFLVLVLRLAFINSEDWRGTWRGAAALAALLGCAGMMVHSLSDFNLHIPANAALFAVLCAAAVSPSAAGQRGIRIRRESHVGDA